MLLFFFSLFINRQLIYNYPEEIMTDAGVASIEHADFEGVERLVPFFFCCILDLALKKVFFEILWCKRWVLEDQFEFLFWVHSSHQLFCADAQKNLSQNVKITKPFNFCTSNG